MTNVTAFVDNAVLPPGNGERLPVIDPANETQVATVEGSGAGGVDRAVSAARRAFRDGPWRRTSAVARQAVLRRVAALVRAHADEPAAQECHDSGIPMRHLAQGSDPARRL